MLAVRQNIALTLTICLLPLSAARAEYKIATVDINRIINTSKESQSLKKSLDAKTLEARKKVEAKRDALKALEEKIKNEGLSEESKEAEKFRAQAKDFSRFVKDSDEALKKDFLKSNKALTDKALTLVNNYAKKHELSMVLDKSESMRGPVLFGAPSYDITDEVLSEVQ